MIETCVDVLNDIHYDTLYPVAIKTLPSFHRSTFATTLILMICETRETEIGIIYEELNVMPILAFYLCTEETPGKDYYRVPISLRI